MTQGTLERYVPNLAAEWDLDAPGRRRQQVDGTLCFVDISGFTNLSEKLARRGRIGAEELTEVLDRVFGSMLRLAYGRGGSLLKFGGDALLLLFQGPDHPLQGAGAAVEMRAALRQATTIPTSVGRIALRMSVGLHTGQVDLFRVGQSHRELVITGPAATTTTEMEKTAEAGEIVVSPALRDALPAGAAPTSKGPGWLLRWRRAPVPGPGPTSRRMVSEDAIALAVPPVLRRHLATARAEPEHRVATVAFVKFKGVDRALAEGGPEAVAEGLEAVVCAAQEAADAEGVTFLATDIDEDGGKVILVAGVPVTQEDDEGRMLRAVRRIADAGVAFPLRIGVNRGHVFAGEIGTDFRSTYTVMGDTVNLAARLMAAAPAGAVYVAPAVLDRSNTLFETEALEPFHVKGKSAPVHAFALGRETGARTHDTHGALPFAGRNAELTLIRAALERLASGTGGVITVIGDTGIGKSRLVEEALARGVSPPVFAVRAEPQGVDNPYWAFRDPLRRLLGIERRSQSEMVGDLSSRIEEFDPNLLPLLPLIGDVTHIEVPDTAGTAAIEPRFRPDRIAGVVDSVLAAVFPGPLAMLIEDGHWLDEASSGLIERLTNATRSQPWLILVTTRPSGDIARLGEVIELGPLSEDEARTLVIAATESTPLRPHEQQAVVERTGGNPLFLQEILRLIAETGAADSLPDSLDAVVGAEIDALPPLARNMLRYSSVLGRSFRRIVLDEFLAPENVELDLSTRRAIARFVEPDGTERWRFRHAVAHDVAYNGLSYRRRRELHARAGAVIERLAGDSPETVAEFLAFHYAEAGIAAQAWKYGVIAGDRARAAYANEEAAGHYVRSLEAARRLPGLPENSMLDVWTRLGDVREAAGLYEPSLRAFRAASKLTQNPLTRADLLLKRARAKARVGSYRAAFREITLGERVVEALDTPEAQRSRARLASLRAQLRQLQEQPRAAIALARKAVAEAESAGEEEALARSCQVLDASYNMIGQPSKAVYGGRALQIYERLGNLAGVADITNNLGGQAYFEGDWNKALDYYAQAEDAYRRAGNEAEAATASANSGEVLVSQHRFTEAEPLLTASVRTLRAHRLMDAALFAELQLARLYLLRGNYEEAADRFRSIRSEALELGQVHSALESGIHIADASLRSGDPGSALSLLDEAEAAAGGEAELYGCALSRVRAEALCVLGRTDEALAQVAAGLTKARDQGLVYEEALLLLTESKLLADPEAASTRVEEAHRLLHSLGVVI